MVISIFLTIKHFKNGGFTLGKVKFGEADVDELFRMFGEIKQTNT